MADVMTIAEQPADLSGRGEEPKPRRPWRTPAVLQASVSRQTNKASDYLPEGHQASTVDIS